MTSRGKRNRTMLGIGQPRVSRELAIQPEATTPDAPSTSEAWIGRVIDGRYEILELLAEGGMGAVYIAKHVKLGRRVAIKLMHHEHEGNDEVAKRFAREIEVTARLTHRHIVSALDCGTAEGGAVYLAMELVTGRSLAEAIEDDGAFDWRRAAEVGAQIADALSAAHRAGVVHRDLKPDNVILEPDDDGETVKLLDFGIAHVSAEGGESAPAEPLTRLGTVLGTVGYMAPEQCLGQPVDGRADLYTLGVLLWEMLAGRTLFDDSLTLTSFITTQLAEERPPIATVVSDVPPALARIVDSLLAPKKADRPGDAQAIRDALRDVASSGVSLVLDADPSVSAAAPDPSITMGTDSTPSAPISAPSVVREASAAQPSTAEPQAAEPPTGEPPTAVPSPAPETAKARPSGKRGGLDAIVDGARALPRNLVIAVAAVSAVLGVVLVVLIALMIGSSDEDEPSDAVDMDLAVEPEDADEAELAEHAPAAPHTGGLDEALSTLLSTEADWRARQEAARSVMRHDPRSDVPPLTLSLAQLEVSSDCRVRAGAVGRLAALGDERTIVPLRRASRARRPRCGRGFVNEVERAIARIRRANRE